MKKVIRFLSIILVCVLLVGCSSNGSAQVKLATNKVSGNLDKIISQVKKLDDFDQDKMDLSGLLGDTNATRSEVNLNTPSQNDMAKNTLPNTRRHFNFVSKNNESNYENLYLLCKDCCDLNQEYKASKEDLLNNCYDCKNLLTRLNNSGKTLTSDQLKTLDSYTNVLSQCLKNLKTCKTCDNAVKSVDKKKVNLASNSSSICADYHQIYNCLDSNCCNCNNANNSVLDLMDFVQNLISNGKTETTRNNPYVRNNRYLSKMNEKRNQATTNNENIQPIDTNQYTVRALDETSNAVNQNEIREDENKPVETQNSTDENQNTTNDNENKPVENQSNDTDTHTFTHKDFENGKFGKYTRPLDRQRRYSRRFDEARRRLTRPIKRKNDENNNEMTTRQDEITEHQKEIVERQNEVNELENQAKDTQNTPITDTNTNVDEEKHAVETQNSTDETQNSTNDTQSTTDDTTSTNVDTQSTSTENNNFVPEIAEQQTHVETIDNNETTPTVNDKSAEDTIQSSTENNLENNFNNSIPDTADTNSNENSTDTTENADTNQTSNPTDTNSVNTFDNIPTSPEAVNNNTTDTNTSLAFGPKSVRAKFIA